MSQTERPPKGFALFQVFSPMEYAHLEKYCLPAAFSPGQFLFQEGTPLDSVFLVLRGHVKFCKKSAGGKERTFQLLGEGDAFELKVGAREEHHLFSARALSEVFALKITPDHFQEHFMAHGAFANRLLGQKVRDLKEFYFSRMASAEPVEIRMAYFLLALARRPGMAAANGKKLDFEVPLTRRDIAEIVNTTVETSIRIGRQWVKRGLITVSKRRYSILNLPAFRKIIKDLPLFPE